MSEAEFRDALDRKGIVAARRTSGSAAPAEVDAMLREAREELQLRRERLAASVADKCAAVAALEPRVRGLPLTEREPSDQDH